MSVTIIENFQLGTNIPLDARYVVNHKNDVSLYWYQGMQLFQTSTKTLEWFDGSIWHLTDSSTTNNYVKKSGDLMYGPLQFSPDNSLNHIGGQIYSPSEGLLNIESSLGIGLTAPYFILPKAKDKVGSYLKVGENGIIQYTTIGENPKYWEDILLDSSTITNVTENEILSITLDDDVSFGSVSYEVNVSLPWWRTVRCKIYVDSSLYSTEEYTGGDNATFADSIPINGQGLSFNQTVKVTIQSDIANYDVIPDTFLKIEKFGLSTGESPLTTKGDLYVYSNKDDRLPIGSAGQILMADPSSSYGIEWVDLSIGYGFFAYWAEESSSPTAGAYEWSWGNGDEAPAGSGVMVPMDCELYAIGTTSSVSSRYRVEILKTGNSVGAISNFMTNGQRMLTILNNPIDFSMGDSVDFKTLDVSVSDTAGIRAAAYFRYKIPGLKGEKGADGDCSIGTTDDLPEGINNLYYTEQRVEDYLITQTYIKEASIGDGFIWDNGQLDVSINGAVGLYAYSKTAGNGTFQATYNLSVNKTATGRYVYTFNNALTNNNYGVLGQPFNTTTDTNIQIYNVTNSGFTLEIGQGDNGTTADVLVDSDHTVMVLGPPTEMGLGVSREYVDGSLAIRDTIININSNAILTNESSINDIQDYQDIQDSSILSNTNLINSLDSSLTEINNYQIIQDISIKSNSNNILTNEASINKINNYQIIQDISIKSNFDEIGILDTEINNIQDYQDIQDSSIYHLEASLGDYVRKDGDTMSGDLNAPNIKLSGFLTPGNQLSFPSTPNAGSIYFRQDLNQLFTYDSSRGKWLSIDRSIYEAGKGRVRSSNIGYLEVGSAAQSSDTGFRMPKSGTIIGGSIQNRSLVSSPRTMSIRINDSSVEELIIPNNEYGIEQYNLNSNFNKGDLIQLVIEAGGTTIRDIIATVNVAWRE